MQAWYLVLILVALGANGSQQVFAQAAGNRLAHTLAYTASPNFPTDLFSQYYYGPSPSRQPQPRIYDEVLDYTYPLELTDPTTIPTEPVDPVSWPVPIGEYNNGSEIVAFARSQTAKILASSSANCTKCQSILAVGQYVAQRVPKLLPDLMVELCQTTAFKSNISCSESYQAGTLGHIWTQVLAFADVAGSDGQYMCRLLNSRWCPPEYTLPSNVSAFFGPRPAYASVPKASGQRVKVLHLSDMHLDPRFAVGQESNCSSGMCCRYPTPANNFTRITVQAPTYGSFKCDSPYYLAVAGLASITHLTDTRFNFSNDSVYDHFAWSLYTGDMVAHDPTTQDSRNLTSYAEYAVVHMMKAYVPSGPIFIALGNHDTSPANVDAPHTLPGSLGRVSSWNYNHVASLWQQNGWISEGVAEQARMHYAAYSIDHPKYPKLRIITLNTDFWYRANPYNYINTTNPDTSGNLKFLAQELQDAEDKSLRVWIVGHVPTGWDGGNPLPNPTDLFYQIVDRFSPHVIAGIFFGHNHEDQFMIYYSDNATIRDAAHAQMVGWIGPSMTPLTNLNSGYRMYEVDTGDFSVYNAYTYYSNVSTYATIDTNISGPVFQYEYSVRDTYEVGWPQDAPLNATYWHHVTEEMERNRSLVSIFNTYQGKSSIRSENCTSEACTQAKICYMRSGSVALGSQCPQGFGSVQSRFTGKNF